MAERSKSNAKGAERQPVVVLHSTAWPHKPPDSALLSKEP